MRQTKNRNYSDNVTPNVVYSYDNGTNAKGKLTKVNSSVSTTEYTSFDILGRVLNHKQTTDGNAYNSSYVYNLSGALIEETYPSGRVVKNTLDTDGDLALVQSSKSNVQGLKMYANAFTYTSAGAVSSLRLGNGKFENTTFNSRLQPIQIGLGSSATSQNLLKLNFDYGGNDNNGNVKSQTITTPTVGNLAGFVATQNYAYDSLNRLKSAVETIPNQTGWKQTFKFDRYGNRTFDTTNNNTTTLANGCPINICNPTANPNDNKLVGTNYDSVGNTKIDANGQVFTYDAENKQTKVVNAQGVTIGEYFYDGDGKRIKKIAPLTSETTIFVYDAAGKTVAEYSTISANQADAKINYTTTDHLGSPRINTDANGNVIARHDTMPFGEEIQRANYGSDNLRNRFTSYERDGETGLDYAKARMFGSGVGRFTSPDPYVIIFEMKKGEDKREQKAILYKYLVQSQNWNRYVYTLNNPLIHTDPLGMRPQNEWEKKAIAKLDELINSETGYLYNGFLKEPLELAKKEIESIIAGLKDGENDKGIQIAVFAILDLDDGRFANKSGTTVTDGKTSITAGEGAKCNIFVAAAFIEGAGIKFITNGSKKGGFPTTDGAAPAANYLGDSKDRKNLSNLSIVTGAMRPGDIAAWRANGGNVSGHSSIYIGGGVVAYAGGSNGGRPMLNTFSGLNNSMTSSGHDQVVVRRYNGKP